MNEWMELVNKAVDSGDGGSEGKNPRDAYRS